VVQAPPPPRKGGVGAGPPYLSRHQAGMGKIGILRGFEGGKTTKTSSKIFRKKSKLKPNMSHSQEKNKNKEVRKRVSDDRLHFFVFKSVEESADPGTLFDRNHKQT